ncbi:MAG TPA: triose-phosphate isomerase [Candidatus Cryosericum sp.]|nr:triose-phosphate isomerase [Candidatus Cryosericum sp.]
MRPPIRRPLVIGNWKMHTTARTAKHLAREILAHVPARLDREVAIAPPFTALAAVGPLLDGSPVRLAAQDLFWEDEGPFTGEISGPMLKETGVEYVLLGHSERRIYLGESDLIVSRKVQAAMRAGLLPVVCVGEDQVERDAGRAQQVVREQLLKSLEGLPDAEVDRLCIAYEPVWAIGTGRSASAADATEMHALIRLEIEARFGADRSERVRILYGGSVTERNIDALMACAEVDGVLVGGASLRALEFARIAGFGAPGRVDS